MPSTLSGKTVAILVADGFEQIEFTSPKIALEKAGARTVVVSLKAGKVEGWNHHEKGDRFPVECAVSDVRADEFDALMLPGGVANPDQLRDNADAVKFVHDFFEQHKPVAAICHGPWTLIDAGVVSGRKLTSYHSIKQDLVNAGADWVDEEVVVDNGLVTSRSPADLGAFNRKMVEEIAEGVHAGQHA
ncbi:MAG: type 1 glutamine amidotransferase domain-containing protein [Phycisphaerales bacterium]